MIYRLIPRYKHHNDTHHMIGKVSKFDIYYNHCLQEIIIRFGAIIGEYRIIDINTAIALSSSPSSNKLSQLYTKSLTLVQHHLARESIH